MFWFVDLGGHKSCVKRAQCLLNEAKESLEGAPSIKEANSRERFARKRVGQRDKKKTLVTIRRTSGIKKRGYVKEWPGRGRRRQRWA